MFAGYGDLTVVAHVQEMYGPTLALVLAAEAFGSTDGGAIRDHLRAVTGGAGEVVIAGPEGVGRALEFLANGAEICECRRLDDSRLARGWRPSRGHVG